MTDQHPHDDIELYALGMLEPAERDQIDAHVATCMPCMQRLAQAEAVGAELAGALPRHASSRALSTRVMTSLHQHEVRPRMQRGWPGWGLAAAAAFALLVGGGWQNYQFRSALQSQDVILAQIVHSHFNHVSLTTSLPDTSFGAKALFARDGSWVYLIVDHPPASLHVMATSASGVEDLGEPAVNNGVATLFLRPADRLTHLDLVVNGKPAATGNLVY
jgi:hypothetical protein